MRIVFEDRSYIDVVKNNDKVIITIVAIDGEKSFMTIVNSVELTSEQFQQLIKNI